MLLEGFSMSPRDKMERTSMESEPPVIRFVQENGYTLVEPGLPRWLLQELTVSGRRFNLGGPRGFQTSIEDDSLYEEGPTGSARILTGLVPRVSASLLQAGYHVKLTGRIYGGDHPPSWDGFQRADPSMVEGLQLLEYEPRGQIVVSTPGVLLDAIVMLCRFFVGKVMIIAESREEMRRLTRSLKRRLEETVVYISRGPSLSESRIEVGTLGSLDLMASDVVILAKASQALLKKTRENLSYLPRQRVYGLQLIPDQESPRRDLLLEGIIGPELFHVGSIWKRERTVSVILADYRCRSTSFGQFGLGWKRRSIWQNPYRNDAIAGIARALGEGDLLKLGDHDVTDRNRASVEAFFRSGCGMSRHIR